MHLLHLRLARIANRLLLRAVFAAAREVVGRDGAGTLIGPLGEVHVEQLADLFQLSLCHCLGIRARQAATNIDRLWLTDGRERIDQVARHRPCTLPTRQGDKRSAEAPGIPLAVELAAMGQRLEPSRHRARDHFSRWLTLQSERKQLLKSGQQFVLHPVHLSCPQVP